MTEKFNGFSQDEINKIGAPTRTKKPIINPTTYTLKPTISRGYSGIRRMPEKNETNRKLCQQLQQQQQKQQQQKTTNAAKSGTNLNSKTMEKKSKCNTTRESIEEFNVDSAMSKSIEEALFYRPSKKSQSNHTSEQLNDNNNGSNESSILNVSFNRESPASSISSNTMEDSSILPPATPQTIKSSQPDGTPSTPLNVESPFKGISLKDFEKHRKIIEEQNRQKKEMLHKAIEQHSQKTAAEARKIEEIKNELAKLDNDLAVDVALLRQQIDTASVHFASIEKQYIKIEAQFLKAKLDLHKAAERKALLTEHLFTVIAHNEDRKAHKLSELMEKVGLHTQLQGQYAPPSPNANVT